MTRHRGEDPERLERVPSPAEQLDGLGLFAAAAADAAAPLWFLNPTTPIEREFVAFHQENPHIYAELERRALALLARGLPRIGLKMIWESMRYAAIEAHGADAWKLNNNFTALYARLLRARRPELASRMELRERREEGAA